MTTTGTLDWCSAHGRFDCPQHQHCQPIVGAVTFSHPGMAEHVRRAVDDYLAGLPEVENDGSTVVELVRRGESWHISIRAGKMYHETAEDSLGAAFDAVGRVLGQNVGSCEEVPTVRHQEWHAGFAAGYEDQRAASYDAGVEDTLAKLPPVQITDPEALAKLTPSKVRAYLRESGRLNWIPTCVDRVRNVLSAAALEALASVEARSSAAVYLDILQTEPEAPSDPPRGYAP